jgi:predicted nucleic acid-binding protein
MKILVDTNVIMDALQERAPFDEAAKKILIMAQRNELTCALTASAITDIFYLFSKARDAETARTAISYLLELYEIMTVSKRDCINALKLPIDDFEDALAAVCAQNYEADYIVTRDEAFLKANLSISVISPSELLNKLK